MRLKTPHPKRVRHPVARSTVHDFIAGTLYSVRQVMGLFGRSDQWVRDQVRAGKLTAAKLAGVGPWLIGGESVRVLYGSLKLAEDAAGPAAPEEPEHKAVGRALKKLAALNAKPKGK